MSKSARKAGAEGGERAGRIVRKPVALAAEVGRESVGLERVAERLDAPPGAVAGRFRVLDAACDARFLGTRQAVMVTEPLALAARALHSIRADLRTRLLVRCSRAEWIIGLHCGPAPGTAEVVTQPPGRAPM